MHPLVTTDWLADHIERDDVVILDATWFLPGADGDARSDYARRHIPGAVFFDIDQVSDHAVDLPHMLPAPAEFAVAARRLGVNANASVVVYDSQGVFSAPRVWWTFRAMGHEATAVLDGGLPRWLAEGRPVESGWREAPHGDFKAHPNPALVRTLREVVAVLATREAQIVDARPASRFTGQAAEPRPGLRSGHMPGARNLPYTLLIAPDGRLRETAEVRAAFEAAGVDLERPIITSCGSGISAALLALGLAIVGHSDAAVYDGSWTEWGGRADTAVVAGPA